MKGVLTLLWGLSSASALANFAGPMLVVTQTEAEQSTQCRIYPDKVQKDRTAASGLRSTELKSVKVDVRGVTREIDRAADGHLSSSRGDRGTSRSYKAVQITPDGTPKVVVLDQKGPEIITNDSVSATHLKNFIDQNCQ